MTLGEVGSPFPGARCRQGPAHLGSVLITRRGFVEYSLQEAEVGICVFLKHANTHKHTSVLPTGISPLFLEIGNLSNSPQTHIQ